MNLSLNLDVANGYRSPSQRARRITENWVLNKIYCPNCGTSLSAHPDNKPVADFYCKQCGEDFELKSKNGKFGSKVTAGAYDLMIKRLDSLSKPNFLFMVCTKVSEVTEFFTVPRQFVDVGFIEKRKPLKVSAKRAGWIGSYISLSKIPEAGRIFYVKEGKEINKNEVLDKWQKVVFIKKVRDTNSKGWILDIMNCIDAINKKEFKLADVYKFENDLQFIHKENKNIKAKIRQQLQILRDKGYLEFFGDGTYRLL